MRTRRSIPMITAAALTAMLGASHVAAVGSSDAGRDDPPGDRDANHCVNDLGVDLNELYGTSDQFRNRFCQDLTAGEHWVIGPLTWIVDDGVDSSYPDGYVPLSPDPVDDFAAKLAAVKVVVDGKVQLFSPNEVLRTDITAAQLEPGVWDESLPMASILPRLQPLSVGEHTFQAFIVLSAEHCDGIAPVPEENCLPPGELAFGPPRSLTITTP